VKRNLSVGDWLVIVLGLPILGVVVVIAFAFVLRGQGFLAPHGLSEDWFGFMLVSPALALGLVLLRRPRTVPGTAALLVNAAVSVVVTYLAVLAAWAMVLCEPGAHDMCMR
jgi:hypothetical protein